MDIEDLVVEVVPGVHRVALGIANAYLLQGSEGSTLIDTGPPGSGPASTAALEHLGCVGMTCARWC